MRQLNFFLDMPHHDFLKKRDNDLDPAATKQRNCAAVTEETTGLVTHESQSCDVCWARSSVSYLQVVAAPVQRLQNMELPLKGKNLRFLRRFGSPP